MKKVTLMMIAACIMSGCERTVLDNEELAETQTEKKVKKFTFTVKGDFSAATFTRAASDYLQADGSNMTDLWIFDYLDGKCVQSVHQTSESEDWGQPSMSLAYGNHHVYFVASRGEGPTVDNEGHAITWTGPRDTFWKDYDVSVVSTSNGNRAVTLDRVATKLRLTVVDKVPEKCQAVKVTPDRWYYGWDYVNGNAIASQKVERVVNVPANYIGTTGQLAVSIFGLSGADEWVTNVAIMATDSNDDVIGSANIVGAPFKANRSTDYSGSLFGSSGSMDVSLNGSWENPKTGNW